MDLNKTRLIESIYAGSGEMGARARALDGSATLLDPLRALLAACPKADAPLIRIEPERETER